MASADAGAQLSQLSVAFWTALLLHAWRPVYLHQAQAAGARPLPPLEFMLFIDAGKLAVCLTFLLLARLVSGKWDKVWCGFRHTLVLAVPATLNLVIFTLTVYATSVLAPPLFLITSAMTIVTTDVTKWLLLSYKLDSQQWFGLLLLTCSTVVGQWNGTSSRDGTLMPVMAVLLNCLLSALVSAYAEKHKKEFARLDMFNNGIHMCLHALLANAVLSVLIPVVISIGPYERITWSGDDKEMTGTALPFGPFWVIGAFAIEALASIVMSSPPPESSYQEGIAKNYVYSTSLFISIPISMLLFGYVLESQFIIGAGLLQHAVMLYGRATEANMLKKD